MKRIEHREKKWQFPFVEYSPEKMTENLPIIIQLHGAGERGEGKEDLSLVDIHGFSKIIAGKDYPCIFIMPQCPCESFWVAKLESIVSFIEKLISERQEPFVDLLNVIVVRIDLARAVHTSIIPSLIEKILAEPVGKV